jgi:DNA repair exonuclease SbcCD ATPase subunit
MQLLQKSSAGKTEGVSPSIGSYADVVKGNGLTRQKAESTAKIEALEKAVEHAGDNPHLQEHKASLEAELRRLRKMSTDTRSLSKQIASKESFIEREQKRIEKLAKELEEATAALTQRKLDLATEEDALAKLKEEKSKEDAVPMEEEELTPENVADLRHMEKKELDLRRKIARRRTASTGENVAEDDVKLWSGEADALADEIEKKRVKLESAAAAHKAKQNAGARKDENLGMRDRSRSPIK